MDTDLSASEKQLLIVLADEGQDVENRTQEDLEISGERYFCGYKLDWVGVWRSLHERRAIRQIAGNWRLSSEWDDVAAELRQKKQPYLYWYNDWYRRGLGSHAHAQLCEEVYGMDLCQSGMATVAQLDYVAATTSGRRLLDLGCGPGLQTEYLFGKCGLSATGIDTTVTAIRHARDTVHKRTPECRFVLSDMFTFLQSGKRYDTICNIDAAYYVADRLPEVIHASAGALNPGGGLIFLYSTMHAEDFGSDENGTLLARALNGEGIPWNATDFTAQEIEHWRRKKVALAALKSQFFGEGNAIVYERRMAAAERYDRLCREGQIRRYAYQAHL